MTDAQLPDDPVADAPVSVDALFRTATAAATPGELVGREAALAAFASTPVVTHRGRRIAVVTALLVLAAGGAAAATGSLPSGLQRAASNLAERVGIDLPAPDQPDDRTGGAEGSTDDGTSETPGAPTDSTPSGVVPDEQRLNGWCTAWNRGDTSSLDAQARQALAQRADDAGVDVDTLCEPFGRPQPTRPAPTTPQQTRPEPTTPTTPQPPTSPPRDQTPGQNGGKQP